MIIPRIEVEILGTTLLSKKGSYNYRPGATKFSVCSAGVKSAMYGVEGNRGQRARETFFNDMLGVR
jgi:hypothetical protein